MPEQNTGTKETGQPESDLVAALRDYFVVAFILLDRHGQSVTLTGRAAHLLGLASRPSHRCPLASLPAPVREVIREVLASGQALNGRRLELAEPGGQTRTIRLSALGMEPGANEAPAAFLVSDLAPPVELEHKLRQLERLASVGTLSAGMAHEIRNALVALRSFTDLLLEKMREAELAALARREIDRIDSLVGRMLSFSGPVRCLAAAVSLQVTLEHSLLLVQSRLKAKSITVNRRFQPAPALVRGEDIQLQQAFLNLFLNALDAMEPDGKLTLTIRPVDPPSAPAAGRNGPASPQIRVMVQDTGPGISAENLPRLFEPFFTTKPNGTGLGLSITRRIIHEHHGEISVRSERGQGTIFEILLPAAA